MSSLSYGLSALFALLLAFVLLRGGLDLPERRDLPLPEPSVPDDSSLYLALTGNKQQLGNQIWSLVSGWSMAKTLGRKFYISQNWHDPELISFKLADVHKIFPGISTMYELLLPGNETVVPHNYYQGKMNICHYEDPLVHQNRPERFLVLDTPYAQNTRYFYEYIDELRKLLFFSKSIETEGNKVMKQLNLEKNDNIVCAHIRRRDFSSYNWQSQFNTTVDLIRFVAEQEKKTRLLMFGDDQTFMEEVITSLREEEVVTEDSFASRNSKGIDLYLAANVCSSVALTSQASSFGYWLAFVSRNQQSVYYLHDEFDPTNPYKPRFDEKFQLPWKDVKLENGQEQ